MSRIKNNKLDEIFENDPLGLLKVEEKSTNNLSTEEQRLVDSFIEICEFYEEILIDEYQDTNKAQDMLFTAISKNNLFSRNSFFLYPNSIIIVIHPISLHVNPSGEQNGYAPVKT